MVGSTIRQYYLLLTLQRCGISMITAVYATFLLAHGLNLLQINLVNLVFFTTLFVCEIPTGAFADVFGRKQSFVASCALFALSMLIYACSGTIVGSIVAEILAAIAHTFMSGAFEAWLTDKLRHHGYDAPLTPVFARASLLSSGAGVIAAMGGAVLYDISPALPWLVSCAFFTVSGTIATVWMKEEYFIRKPLSVATGIQAFKETITASISYGTRNKNVRFVMFMVLALSFAVMAPNMQWQPLFRDGLPNQTHIGLLWTGMALMLMLGSWQAPRLLQYMSERRALLLCHVVTAAGIAGTVLVGLFPAATVVFLAHEIGRGAFGPIKSAYLHDNIPSKERATIVSFESIAHHIGGAIGLVVSGLLAHYGSIPLAWIVAASILLIAVLFLSKNGK